jgi:chemotaxis protein CheD
MVGFGSSESKGILTNRVIVGVGDMATTDNRMTALSTYALGSCVGIVAFDPGNIVGGMLHVMLPDSRISVEKAQSQPFIFADTGMDCFLASLVELGAAPDRLKIVLAGGASAMSSSDAFKIGEKNIIAVKLKLTEFGLITVCEQLGGFTNRSLHFDLQKGRLLISLPDQNMEVDLS